MTDAEGVIRALAARQHGVVARAQLLDAGVAPHVIDYRVKQGRLHGLHRGVYRVGPVAARREQDMAALLACGEGAVLSHRSAAGAWGLLPHSAGAPVEVSIPRGCPASGARMRVHRIPGLEPDEATVVEGIAITAPARTVLDLAGSVGGRELEQALAQAERSGLTDHEGVSRLVARYPRRWGARALRALLAGAREPALTRSEAESRFLALVRKSRLRPPEVNAKVQGYEVDFLWRAAQLVVEVDGFAFHSSPSAFERDRRRDAALAAAGLRVVRVTWRQIVGEPEVLLVRLAQTLSTG